MVTACCTALPQPLCVAPVLWLLAVSITFYLEGSFMDKWQQKFSIGYFFVALILLFLLQNYLASPPTESIDYSQFKALVNNSRVANLTVGEKTIRGEIKPEAAKDVLPPEKLKAWAAMIK